MTCDEFLQSLWAAAPGRLGEAGPGMKEHAANCERCRSARRVLQSLGGTLHVLGAQGRMMELPALPPSVPAPARRWPRWAPYGVAVSLASLALAVAAGWFWGRGSQTTAAAPTPMKVTFVLLPYADPAEAIHNPQIERVMLSPTDLVRLGLPAAEGLNAAPVPAELMLNEDGTPEAIRWVSKGDFP